MTNKWEELCAFIKRERLNISQERTHLAAREEMLNDIQDHIDALDRAERIGNAAHAPKPVAGAPAGAPA
jgi:molecular chaperone GrpE (heat shock protein)